MAASTDDDPQHGVECDSVLRDSRIPPTVVVGLVSIAEDQGQSTERWFTGTGLSRAQLEMAETRLSFRQTAIILRRGLRELPETAVGIRVGGRDVVVSWGVLGLALRSARTAAEAVDIALRLHQAAGSLLDCSAEYGPEIFELRLAERSSEPELLPFLCEEACSAIVTLLRAMFGRQFVPNSVDFAYPTPARRDVYERFFRCQLRFGAEVTRICFDASLLDRAVPTANPAQLELVVHAAEKLADTSDYRSDIVTAVEGVLRENLRHPITMAQVAEKLVTTERTLHRRLGDAGQRFTEIRDRVRAQRAGALLRETALPIAVVATEVGFSESREFRRAYRRWTGRVPSSERA